MFDGGVEALSKMRTVNTNTVRTPHLILVNDQCLLIFSKVSLATRWIDFNVSMTFITLIF